VKEIEGALAKGPRRGPKPAEGAAETEADEDSETVEDEAA
jgi:CarD family transcriptional regulator